jgi:hypothetical protein
MYVHRGACYLDGAVSPIDDGYHRGFDCMTLMALSITTWQLISGELHRQLQTQTQRTA